MGKDRNQRWSGLFSNHQSTIKRLLTVSFISLSLSFSWMNCFKTQWAWSLRPRNQRGKCFRRRERTSFPLGIAFSLLPYFILCLVHNYAMSANFLVCSENGKERGWWCKGWRAFTWPRGKWKWKSLSCVRPFATPWSIQPMEFSRSECWTG